jgi:hypothetical protein
MEGLNKKMQLLIQHQKLYQLKNYCQRLGKKKYCPEFFVFSRI